MGFFKVEENLVLWLGLIVVLVMVFEFVIFLIDIIKIWF